MGKELYGVDLDKPITPLIVRDAIIECFYKAHCMDAQLSSGKDPEIDKIYCGTIVKKAFKDTGGDFDKPTKESIMKVLGRLAEFAKTFRNPEIIKKHYNEIMELVNKL